MPKGSASKRSAGILMYRQRGIEPELLLVHPGGPFWRNKDLGAWSIPKGEYAEGEDPLAVARREFEEETGTRPQGEFRPLGEIIQAGGKRVSVWAVEGDFDPEKLVSNTFELEWPPRSGRKARFAEVDRAAWFSPSEARDKILAGQRPFIDRLARLLGISARCDAPPTGSSAGGGKPSASPRTGGARRARRTPRARPAVPRSRG